MAFVVFALLICALLYAVAFARVIG